MEYVWGQAAGRWGKVARWGKMATMATFVSGMTLIPAAVGLFLTLGLPNEAQAAERCMGVVSDEAEVQAARTALNVACPCAPATEPGDRERYLICVLKFVRDAVERGLVRPECKATLRTSATRSTCARVAGAVTCCGQGSGWLATCKVVSDSSKCSGFSWLGGTNSCFDSCNQSTPPPFPPLCSTLNCNDHDPCTDDSCDPVDGCRHVDNHTCNVDAQNCAGTGAATLEMQADEIRVIDLINRERAKRGRAALRVCRTLGIASQKHSADMRDRKYYSHESPNGDGPWDRDCKAGFLLACGPLVWMGENIVAGSGLADDAFQAWMHSPGHRDLMLDEKYQAVGVGHACQGPVWESYWTADFAGAWDSSCN